MPSQKYDISILLSVLSQGDENLENLAKAIQNLAKAGEVARRALAKDFFGEDATNRVISRLEKIVASVRKLDQVDIGGTQSFEKLRSKIFEIQKQAEKGVFINTAINIKELDIYIKRLEDVRKAAEKLDDKELFKSISAQIDGAKILKDNFLQASKISVDKNISTLKVLLDDVNSRIKTTVSEAKKLASTGSSPADLSVYIQQLKDARDNLKFLSEEARGLGVSTKTIDASITKLNNQIKELKTGKPAQIGTVQGLDEIINKFQQFEQNAKAGIPIDFQIPRAELDQLERKLVVIRKTAADNQDVELFRDSNQLLQQLENARQELKKIEQIQLDKSITPYKLELKQVSNELGTLTKQGQNLIDTGADVATLGALRDRVITVRNNLVALREDAQRLGKSTVDIEIKLDGANKLINQLDSIDADQVRIKRNEIDLKVKNKLELDNAVNSLKELNKQLGEAVEHRDFRAISDLKAKVENIKNIQRELAPRIQNTGNVQAINVFSGFTQGLAQTEARLNQFRKEAGSGLGLVFNRVRSNITNTFKDAGGSNTIIRSIAGSFRLLGTSAFLVGGELRSLGFAFSAIGTIIQSFVPLIGTLIKAFGLASIPVIALAGYLATLAIQGIAIIGVLAGIAKEGLKFNDAFARTRNNIAGIVGLFFDVKENGESVGKGLDPTSAAMERLAATSQVVGKELRALTFEALTTEFTTEELFPAFNAVATAASRLSPNIETLTELTGGLARVSSVAGVSAVNLSSAITQLISGTGRVTNPLQRFFNQIKDSQGIELTAKRIKELRAAGGTKLVDELLLVTEKFSVLGQEQAKTLSGSFSNIVDAFQLFSGAATQKAYDTLRAGFERIKGLVTEQVQKTRINAEGIIENVTVGPKGSEKPLLVSQFTKPVLELQDTLNNLFNVVSTEFLNFFNKVVQYAVSIGKVLTDNYGTILQIFETFKFILSTLGQIINDFLAISSISNDTTNSIKDIFTISKALAYIIHGIRITLIGVDALITGIVLTISTFIRLLVKIASLSPILKLLPGFTEGSEKTLKELDEFNSGLYNGLGKTKERVLDANDAFAEYQTTLKNLGKTRAERFAEINKQELNLKDITTALPKKERLANPFSTNISAGRINKLLESGATASEIAALGYDSKLINKVTKNRNDRFTLTPNSTRDIADTEGKKAKERFVSLYADRKAFDEAVIALNKATEDTILNLAKDRLNRQQSLIQAQLDANVLAQESATAKILAIKQQELKLDEQAKLNDIARAVARQRLLEDDSNKERARLENSKIKPNEKVAKLEELELKRAKTRLDSTKEIQKLEGEILQNKEKQLDLQLETVREQLKQRQELIKSNQELERSIIELGSKTAPEALANSIRSIVEERADEIRKLQVQQEQLKTTDFANLGVFGGAAAFLQQKQLIDKRLTGLQKELDLRAKLARFDFIQNVFQTRQGELRLREDEIQQKVTEGRLSEQEAAIQTRVIQLQYVAALQEAVNKLEEINNKTAEQQELIRQNKLEIAKLSAELPDSGILEVTRTVGDGFTTLFEKIQEDVGNTKNAFADLANSILASFRKLIAQRLSEALFEKFLAPKNGKKGVIESALESIGLSKNKRIEEEARARVANQTNEALGKTQASLEKQKEPAVILEEVNNTFKTQTGAFVGALKVLTDNINKAATSLPVFNANEVESQARAALNNPAFNVIASNTNLANQINNLILLELRNIANLLANSSVSSTYDFGSIIPPEEKNGGLIRQIQYFAKGGAAKGKDVIPAYLSNGEYIFPPEMVEKIGLPALNYMNKYGKLPKLASGGLFENFGIGRNAPTSFGSLFNFAGGGADLINKPAAIIEKAAEPAKKKIGRLRSIFGNILSFAAPFLRFIPVIGPFLSLGAGALGGALTGSTKGKLGGILGGLFGGLSNLGGFTGKGGFLGNLSNKVGSPTGQLGLSLFSSVLGNSGNALGQLGLKGFQSGKFGKLFDLFKGNTFGFLKKILGFFDLFKFGRSFDLTSILGKKDGGLIPRFAGGGSANLGQLVGLFSAFTSISSLFSNKGNQQDYVEEIVDDPDAARKNLFGSAYSKLIESSFIPDFKYSESTLEKLRNQFNGIKNLIKVPKQSFFSKLFAILPSLAGLFNFGKGTGSKISPDVVKSLPALFGTAFSHLAGGGKVSGKGTATSDSILSLIRPDSFVLKAKSVKALEQSLLSSIDSQIFRFADGGSVSSSLLQALPDLVPNVTTGSQSVSIHNYTDFDSAIHGYLTSPQGTKAVLNLVNKNKNSVNGILRGRRQ